MARRWSEKEKAALESLVGQGDLNHVTKQLNAKTGGGRSTDAVQKQIYKMGYTLRTQYGVYSISEFARILNVPISTVRGWVRLGLPVRNPGLKTNTTKYIAVNSNESKALVWIREHEYLFYGLPKLGLLTILSSSTGCEALADRWSKLPRNRKPTKLYCKETNKTYQSVLAASLDPNVYVTRSTLQWAFNQHKGERSFKCGGYEWVPIS